MIKKKIKLTFRDIEFAKRKLLQIKHKDNQKIALKKKRIISNLQLKIISELQSLQELEQKSQEEPAFKNPSALNSVTHPYIQPRGEIEPTQKASAYSKNTAKKPDSDSNTYTPLIDMVFPITSLPINKRWRNYY